MSPDEYRRQAEEWLGYAAGIYVSDHQEEHAVGMLAAAIGQGYATLALAVPVEVTASGQPQPSTGPRTWSACDTIPDDVRTVKDSEGDTWTRDATRHLWTFENLVYSGADLVKEYGPVTEVTTSDRPQASATPRTWSKVDTIAGDAQTVVSADGGLFWRTSDPNHWLEKGETVPMTEAVMLAVRGPVTEVASEVAA